MGSLGSLFKRPHDRSLHFSISRQIPFRAKLFPPKSKTGKIGREEGTTHRFVIPCAVFSPASAQWYFRGIRRNRPPLGVPSRERAMTTKNVSEDGKSKIVYPPCKKSSDRAWLSNAFHFLERQNLLNLQIELQTRVLSPVVCRRFVAGTSMICRRSVFCNTHISSIISAFLSPVVCRFVAGSLPRVCRRYFVGIPASASVRFRSIHHYQKENAPLPRVPIIMVPTPRNRAWTDNP